ncbi:hypothetical protein QZH41_008088 [Actinostola sp. cb2023]|nr:hypothetical protein QZH41_008088 [Actinostola sp. cb2023]
MLLCFHMNTRVCPYYMARELKSGADIIFMPYNYLLDAKSRKAHNLDISGSIVVFDEAHNVEKVCEETVSFDLTSFDMASCVEDVILCMEFLANQTTGLESDEETTLFSKLEEEIDKIPLPKGGGQSFPSSFMFELMSKCGITSTTKGDVLGLLEKLNPILASGLCEVRARFKEEAKKPGCVDLRVEGRTLSYWCFSPGHAMQSLMAHGVRSLILTSGTLSPLSSFTAELQIPFKIHLENPHVIEKHQIWVGVVTKAPDGATLNSSFEFSDQVAWISAVFLSTGIASRISQHKPMFAEPKGKGDFLQVSEGLDFSDINGRAVVITGLPFPPKMDPKINLKMNYLDEMLRKDKGAFKVNVEAVVVDGDDVVMVC